MLKVKAKDFGPIIEGAVELKPLTVFVGASNTGKSYMATLIYALMRAIAGRGVYSLGSYTGEIDEDGLDFVVSRNDFLFRGNETEFDREFGRAINEWVRSINPADLESSGKSGLRYRLDSFPPVIQDRVNQNITSSLRLSVERFSGELQRCHGDIADLRRRSEASFPIDIHLDQTGPYPLSLYIRESDLPDQLSVLSQNFSVSDAVVDFDPRDIRMFRRISRVSGGSEEHGWADFELFSKIVSISRRCLFGSLPRIAYYLPAARSGIAQGHKVISSILVRQSPFAALRPLAIPTLAGVITDFMGHILTMEQSRRRRSVSAMADVSDFLETEVVRGSIDIENQSDAPYPEISYEPFAGQPNAGKFPFHKTSSMVSELAPVILFLKYLVRPGDLLILEEPESHLHPASQRQMARGIVRLVNAGVKVLITTHSDYLVSQLNNLMRISHASDRWLKREGFAREDCLKHDDVSAYAFRWDDEAGGSRVIQLEIRKDVGIDEDEFALVANDLYNETTSFQRIRVK